MRTTSNSTLATCLAALLLAACGIRDAEPAPSPNTPDTPAAATNVWQAPVPGPLGLPRIGTPSFESPPIDPLLALGENLPVDGTPALDVTDAAAPDVTPDVERFVVHEWGTYTSAMGSNGWELRGMHTEEEALPSFVFEPYASFVMQTSAGQPDRDREKGIHGVLFPTTQKLETPVLYFYADHDLEVTVDVAFREGIISQVYPRPSDAWPYGMPEMVPYNSAVSPLGDDGAPTVGDRAIWEIVATTGQVAPPPVDPEGIWAPSRRVASLGVRSRPGPTWRQYSRCVDRSYPRLSASECVAAFEPEEERFIFYRGLGRFRTDVSVTSVDDTIAIHNAGGADVPAVFVLDVDPAAGHAWIAPLGRLPGQSSMSLDTESTPAGLPTVPLPAFADHAADLVHAELVASGLFDDEARAMVDTWRRSYFELPGLRVLYIAPPSWPDALLPLEIRPEPTELVRVFIGRIEVFTQTREAELLDAFAHAQSDGTYGHLRDELERLYEPALFRMLELTEGDQQRLIWSLIVNANPGDWDHDPDLLAAVFGGAEW